MGLDLGIITIISAIGFVAAAIVAYMLVNLEQILDIGLPRNSAIQWIVALPLAAFVGPYWVARESLIGVNNQSFSLFVGGLGAIISVIWSFCAGVFVVEFLHLIQVV